MYILNFLPLYIGDETVSFFSYSIVGKVNFTHTTCFAYKYRGKTLWLDSVSNTLCSPIVLEAAISCQSA